MLLMEVNSFHPLLLSPYFEHHLRCLLGSCKISIFGLLREFDWSQEMHFLHLLNDILINTYLIFFIFFLSIFAGFNNLNLIAIIS